MICSFVNSIRPLLRDSARITIQAEPTPAGTRFTVVPLLAGMKPETDDPALAELQAALSQPFSICVPTDADADAALSAALRQMAEARSPGLDALASYRASIAEASTRAVKAAETKAATKASSKAAGGKPASHTAPATATAPDAASDEPAAAPVPAPAAPPAAAAAVPAAGLFDI